MTYYVEHSSYMPIIDTQPVQLMRFKWYMKTILRDKTNFDILEGFL